ncbi:MAG: nucleotide exchange factor GrpE [Acidobacteriia bacterium]|nr:nucleotide exchange factor GrpE [Terriglobia bacterium]
MDSRKIPISANEHSPLPTDLHEEPSQLRVVDKRHFTQADLETPVSGPVEDKPRYPTYVEELMARVAETERRFSERVKLVDQEIARSKARLEAEYERKLALSKQSLLLPFLDVLDNLERALRAASIAGIKDELLEGVKMTAELFCSRLREHGIEPIEVLNQPFDPNLSQAVGVVPVYEQDKDGLVVEEVLRGYRMEKILVRPAQVRVGQYQQDQKTSA